MDHVANNHGESFLQDRATDHLEILDRLHDWSQLEVCPSYCQGYYPPLFQG